jgi:hypothetical protein
MGATGHLEHSAVSEAFDYAVAAAVAGEHAYPEGSAFVAADLPHLADAVRHYLDRGQPVVVVYEDGKTAVVVASPPPRGLLLVTHPWRRSGALPRGAGWLLDRLAHLRKPR